MQNPAYTKKHWIVLLIICLMMGASIGLLSNLNGVYYAPMSRDLGVLRGSVSLHGTFMSFATAFTSLTIPTMVERLGFKKTIALGVGLAATGTFLMSFTSNLFLIYLFGIIRGIGSSYYSLVPMSMILNRWFEQKNGLAIGLASGFSGVVSAIAAPFFSSIIQSSGWRMGFRFNSLFILILALPAILYPYALNPEEEGLLPYGHNKKHAREVIRRSEITEVSPTNFVFIALMLIGFLNTFIVFMNSHLPGYGETLGMSAESASFMLSAVMIGNLTGKAAFGMLSDRFGAIKTSLTIMTISFISILIIIFLPYPAPLNLGSFLFGFTFSIGGVALPVLSNKFFGPVAGGKVYSRVNFLSSAGGALSVSLTGYIFDFTGSYVPAFALGLLLHIVDATLLIFAKKSYDKNQAFQ